MDTDALVTRIKSEFNEPGHVPDAAAGRACMGNRPGRVREVVERLVAEQFLLDPERRARALRVWRLQRPRLPRSPA